MMPRSHKALHVGLTALLCLVIWLTYRPALKHVARDDQWNFLTEARYQRHFKRLVAGYYAFNRTSVMGRGDYPLFRPLLYVLLAAEKALFDHRFAWWQTAGILVHCAVVYLFLTLLLRLDRLGAPSAESARFRLRTLAAYGLALFFSVNVSIMELVIYHHLTAYMVFVLFELGVMVLAVDLLAEPNSSVRMHQLRVAGVFTLLLLAAFTYEIGQFFAVVVGVMLGTAAWREGKRWQAVGQAALCCSVLLLFQLADRTDRFLHPPRPQDLGESTVLAEAWTPATVVNAGRYLTFCIVQPFFPSCVNVQFASRLVVPEPITNLANYLRPDPLLGISLLVVFAAVVLTVIRLRWLGSDPCKESRLITVVLAAALVALHMSIIVLGRMNMRPRPNILSMNSYYAYLPLAMLLVGLYAFWSSAPSASDHGSERIAGGFRAAIVAGLLVLSVASAGKVYDMNCQITTAHRPLRSAIAFFDNLVRQHAVEPRFAMAFSPEAWQRFGSFRHRYVIQVPLPVALHACHVDYENPTHIVTVVDGKWHVDPVSESRADWRAVSARARLGAKPP
jgi:hypothetical protein